MEGLTPDGLKKNKNLEKAPDGATRVLFIRYSAIAGVPKSS